MTNPIIPSSIHNPICVENLSFPHCAMRSWSQTWEQLDPWRSRGALWLLIFGEVCDILWWMNMNYNVSWRYISIAYISMVMSYSEHGLEITGRTYSSILISRTLKQRLPKLPAPAGFVLGVSNVRGEYCHFMGVPFNKINHKPSTEQPVWPEPIDARSVHFRSLSSDVRLLTSGQPLESWQGERFVAPKPRRC